MHILRLILLHNVMYEIQTNHSSLAFAIIHIRFAVLVQHMLLLIWYIGILFIQENFWKGKFIFPCINRAPKHVVMQSIHTVTKTNLFFRDFIPFGKWNGCIVWSIICETLQLFAFCIHRKADSRGKYLKKNFQLSVIMFEYKLVCLIEVNRHFSVI